MLVDYKLLKNRDISGETTSLLANSSGGVCLLMIPDFVGPTPVQT